MTPAPARPTPGHKATSDRLLTPEEVAQWLGTSRRFVRRLVSERRIAYRKLGRYVRFHPDDLHEYVTANRVEVRAAADAGVTTRQPKAVSRRKGGRAA